MGIELAVKPKIVHDLKEIGLAVKSRIEELDLDNQVATEQTLKHLKKTRALLNKELLTYTGQLKLVVDAASDPITTLKLEFKENITTPYTEAVEQKLKPLIDKVEIALKEEKENMLIKFYDELCVKEEIDFVPFRTIIEKVNRSESDKSYKDKIIAHIDKVKDDITLINLNEYKNEIMIEYRLNLNVSKSIKDVTQRKELLKLAIEKEHDETDLLRKKELIELGLEYDEMLGMYIYDESINVEWSDIESRKMDSKSYASKLFSLKDSIKQSEDLIIARNKKDLLDNESVVGESKEDVEYSEDSTTSKPFSPPPPPASKPLSSPKVIKPVKLPQAVFAVSGTIKDLKAIGSYIRSLGLEPVNLNKNNYQNFIK